MRHYCNLAVTVAFATVTLAGATSSAVAQTMNTPWDGPRSVRVSYRDLNINEEAGAQVMLGRIRHAAKRACGPAEYDGMTDGARDYARCVRESVTRAVADLNSPVVAALANPQQTRSRTKLAQSGR
jgi:UrcA family protein